MQALKTSARPQFATRKATVSARRSVVVRADGFFGSPENLSVIVGTTLCLAAGRFGLAPTVNKPATPGLKLVSRNGGLSTGDPAGFTAVDVLALGAMGHIIGVGAVLGHRALGL